jgi:Lrp/AsnC family transcriptional regulator, leucine-responsive regulatory protein
MNTSPHKLLDTTGLHILRLLYQNARLSYAEIGRRVHLSTPAVIDRIEKMEEAGIITGYHVQISPASLGYTVAAIITVTTEPVHYPTIRQIVQDTVEIEACDHVTGAASFIMRVSAVSLEQLERVIAKFSSIATTDTAMVLSSLDTSDAVSGRIEALQG